MPNAVGSLISESDLKDLVFITGHVMLMLSLILQKLVRSAGAHKNIDRLPSDLCFAAGTKKLYALFK